MSQGPQDPAIAGEDREAMKLALRFIPLRDQILIDEEKRLVIAYGVKISPELLKTFSEPTPLDRAFRVVSVKDGVATVETIQLFERRTK